MKKRKPKTILIMAIGMLAITVSCTSCDFMAGMALGAASGLANSAYYYANNSYNSNFSSGTYTSSSSNRSASSTSSVEKTLETESDGFSWYKLSQNGKEGAQSLNGSTLIPLSRGYDWIRYDSDDDTGGFFYVTKNNKDGACDKNGKEIVAPKYETFFYSSIDGFNYQDASGNFIPLGITLNNGIAQYTSKHSSSSSSSGSTSSSFSSTTSSSGAESGLLYQGIYTEGNTVYDDGQSFPPTLGPREIRIYEDHLEDLMCEPGFWKIQNGKRVYYNSGDVYTYYVDKNYNITVSFNNPFATAYSCGHATIEYSKGESTMPQSVNYGGGTGTYNSGNTGSGSNGNKSGTSGNPVQPHQITEDCPICHGSGKCNTCNGRGWIYAIGSSDHLDCPNCKPDGHCSHCGGSGKVTKTRYY